ncbi:MAG: hypothetical protein AABX29_03955 [Nanoarchaeota archaeon]
MSIKEIPPLELSLKEADKYDIERVGMEFDGNPVYAWYGTFNVDLYRLVIRKNGFPDKKMLVYFFTGRREEYENNNR